MAEICSMSRISGLGLARLSVNVRGPVTVIGFFVFTLPRLMRITPIAPVLTIRLKVQATSADVSGLPRLLFTPLRNVKRYPRPFGKAVYPVARSGFRFVKFSGCVAPGDGGRTVSSVPTY